MIVPELVDVSFAAVGVGVLVFGVVLGILMWWCGVWSGGKSVPDVDEYDGLDW
jgi:hypothetical protein